MVQGSLDDSEVKVRGYERTCDEVLSDRVKMAVVQAWRTKTSDAICSCAPDAFRRTPSCVSRFGASSWLADTLSGPAPMDVSAVYRGKGKGKGKEKGNMGKSKGKWKDKDKEAVANPNAEVTCNYCNREGRRK